VRVKLPNFLIVGAAKCGTSSLFHYVRQHPDVFMPEKKEPRFFLSSLLRNVSPNDPQSRNLEERSTFDFEDYVKLFESAGDEKAIGEATVTYLYHYEVAIPEITEYLGDPRIIMILRNPVDRAFSSYVYSLSLYSSFADDFEVLSFEECLELEGERKRENWTEINLHQDGGFYYEQVRAYMESFSAVQVNLYDDLVEDALGLVQGVYEFLGVDPAFVPHTGTKRNVSSGYPKSVFFHRFLTRPNILKSIMRPVVRRILPQETRAGLYEGLKSRNLITPEMKPETRERLKNAYRGDILKLQDLIERDLSHWLE
jgi:hypothetical protein